MAAQYMSRMSGRVGNQSTSSILIWSRVASCGRTCSAAQTAHHSAYVASVPGRANTSSCAAVFRITRSHACTIDRHVSGSCLAGLSHPPIWACRLTRDRIIFDVAQILLTNSWSSGLIAFLQSKGTPAAQTALRGIGVGISPIQRIRIQAVPLRSWIGPPRRYRLALCRAGFRAHRLRSTGSAGNGPT
jgi:hypothetical protein